MSALQALSGGGARGTASAHYQEFVRPKLVDLLAALQLDKAYVRASGSYLYDEAGSGYLDMVGGFGAALFGHNHPELTRTLIDSLTAGLPEQAQVSVAVEAGWLAARLNHLVSQTADYCSVFANGGAECVEAALKHAYWVHMAGVQRDFERARNFIVDECERLEDAPPGAIALPDGLESLADLRQALEKENRAALEACVTSPIVVALEGSYHGKSTAALKVTHNEQLRAPFQGLSAIVTRFIDPKRPDLLRSVVAENRVCFTYPMESGGRVTLRSLPATRVFAFLIEPILGEGGIRPVPDASMAAFAAQHPQLRVPFIVDEIQTGCGRTGSVFAFRDTPLGAIDPEYLMLGKALGGGLTKIGATLVRKDVYNEDFGLLHGSTFAENGLACRVARASLDMLLRDDGRLLRQVSETGDDLKSKLESLQRRHPAMIADVRGKGLMLGLELCPLDGRSRFLAEASRQGVLPLLVSSYLHRYHRIRLLPPLGSALPGASAARRPSVLRLQPPATITKAEVDRLIGALDEVLTIIERNNEHCLLAHLWGGWVSDAERANPPSFADPPDEPVDTEKPDVRVGFVLHPPHVGHMVSHYMPSLDHYGWDWAALERWWSRVTRFLDPVILHQAQITSRGRTVFADLVLLPSLPKDIMAKALRAEMADKVATALRMANQRGEDKTATTIVGLGGYTSIVTGCGRSLPYSDVPITTGNAYTVGLVIKGIERAARESGVDLAASTVAVVGACGNIGLALAENLAPRVGGLLLVGRSERAGRLRLNYARRACLKEVERVQARTDPCACIVPPPGPDIALSCDIDSIRTADIVVVTTNSTNGELIRPGMLKQGAIVCCASLPSNVGEDVVKARPDCFLFAGGLALLPDDSVIDLIGLPKGGLAWACLSETIILGLDGTTRSVGKGRVRAEDVERILELADRYGFRLGPLRTIGEAEAESWQFDEKQCERPLPPQNRTKAAMAPSPPLSAQTVPIDTRAIASSLMPANRLS